jgi:DNA-binding response OmpR family regulator
MAALTTVLVCARPDLESDLCRTLFWRDDLERYVADRAEDARTLALSTEPHVVVIDLSLNGSFGLIESLRNLSLPHTVSIVALSEELEEEAAEEVTTRGADTVLTLPSSPAWDERLVEVLSVPTRKQARYSVRFDIVTMRAKKPIAHKGLALNMSAGGILVECPEARLQPGDDVTLTLPIPGLGAPVEGRARVIRQPVEEHLGLRFEAFSGDGDEKVRAYLAMLAAQPSPPE